MTHARNQIRTRVATQTLTPVANLTAANQIYVSRAFPKTQLPAIGTYNGQERVELENETLNATKVYRRFFDLIIEVVVQSNDDGDGQVDDICEAIEPLMAADNTMGGGVIATDLISTTYTTSGAGEKQTHSARLMYRVEYRTTAADPSTFQM